MEDKSKTQPVEPYASQHAPYLTIAPNWTDPKTGATYVHQDLTAVLDPWDEEGHISPMNVNERFGDVESFVKYVQSYGYKNLTLLTWNAQGLKAILDYADCDTNDPGRCQWLATHPFKTSSQWQAWLWLTGQALTQKMAVEKLEDLSEDIVEPASTDLMNLLRSLRASVNAKAEAELRPDGTTSVAFARDTQVKAGAALDLPPSFSISIPVLKGHVDSEGKPVFYKIPVRLRVSVDDQAHLAFRFSIPTADRVLESVYADRVSYAKGLLGEDYELLRAAD